MTPTQVILAAAALIEPPGCWTQGACARDDAGESVMSTDPAAVCWCPYGAVIRVTNLEGPWVRTVRWLEEALGTSSIATWNDSKDRTQRHVVAEMRRIAKQLEGR